MKNDYPSDNPVYFLVFILFVLTACAFFVAGRSNGIEKLQQQAVSAKQAHWLVDDAGKTTFCWGPKKMSTATSYSARHYPEFEYTFSAKASGTDNLAARRQLLRALEKAQQEPATHRRALEMKIAIDEREKYDTHRSFQQAVAENLRQNEK